MVGDGAGGDDGGGRLGYMLLQFRVYLWLKLAHWGVQASVWSCLGNSFFFFSGLASYRKMGFWANLSLQVGRAFVRMTGRFLGAELIWTQSFLLWSLRPQHPTERQQKSLSTLKTH